MKGFYTFISGLGTSIVQFKLDLALLYSLINSFLSLYNINDTRTFFCLALHIVLTDPSFISVDVISFILLLISCLTFFVSISGKLKYILAQLLGKL